MAFNSITLSGRATSSFVAPPPSCERKTAAPSGYMWSIKVFRSRTDFKVIAESLIHPSRRLHCAATTLMSSSFPGILLDVSLQGSA